MGRILFSGIVVFLSFCFAQKITVIDVLASNDIVLSDSSIVKLADIDIPSAIHFDENLSRIGKMANAVLKQLLLHKVVSAEFYNTKSDTILSSVSVYRHSKQIDPAEHLLKLGFAKLSSTKISSKRSLYLFAEAYAKELNVGVWSVKQVKKEIFQPTYLKSEALLQEKINDIKSRPIPEITTNKVLAEIFLAPVGGIIGLGIGGLIGAGIASNSSSSGGHGFISDGVGEGALIGLLLGFSAGVYIVAKHYDPNISYWNTFLASLAGTASGLLTGYIIKLSTDSDQGYIAIPIMAIAGTVLYTNVFSSSLNQPAVTEEELELLNKYGVTHQEIYNYHKLVEFELFRINF